MKDILEAFSSRMKSPYYGYLVLAFFALNWRGIFLLIATEGKPAIRLAAFDSVTSIGTLLIYPILVGFLVASTSHWVVYFFAIISRLPIQKMDVMALDEEHSKLIRQHDLEKKRDEIFAQRENEIIERAKRDAEVSKIDDEDIKNKVSSELQGLRTQKDIQNVNPKILADGKMIFPERLTSEEKSIIKSASKHQMGIVIKSKNISKPYVQAGDVKFGIESRRDYVVYSAAVDDLYSKGYLIDVDGAGQAFELSRDGWALSENFGA